MNFKNPCGKFSLYLSISLIKFWSIQVIYSGISITLFCISILRLFEKNNEEFNFKLSKKFIGKYILILGAEIVGKEIPKFITELNLLILGNFKWAFSKIYPYILSDNDFSLKICVSISYKDISILPMVK